MLPIVRSKLGDQDLDVISRSIAEHNPVAAFRWLEDIESTLALAATFPGIGEAVEKYGTGVRRICQGSYLIFFRVHADCLELVRVLHGSPRIETLLD